MTEQSPDQIPAEGFKEDHGESLRTTLRTPAADPDADPDAAPKLPDGERGVIRNEAIVIKPPERPQAADGGFNALLIVNQMTYRRNNIIEAIAFILKHESDAIPYFEKALADYVTEDTHAAAEG